jgi:4-amino-4-deoxychorismate lyase
VTIVNGTPLESVSVADRGLLYGDGVFRTLLVRAGKPLHWSLQYSKLTQDCAALNLRCPDETRLAGDLRDAAAGHALAVARITVTRGGGVRGYAPPKASQPTCIVTASAHQPRSGPAGGVALHLCHLRLAHQPALAGVKHLNRLENVLARAEWDDPALQEGLLLDQDGFVIGGTMSNLFIVENGRLVTPLLDRCGVAGVTRARIMTVARALKIPFAGDRITLERVMAAAEVFLVNSVIGVWPVARLGDRVWDSGNLTGLLMQSLATDDGSLD